MEITDVTTRQAGPNLYGQVKQISLSWVSFLAVVSAFGLAGFGILVLLAIGFALPRWAVVLAAIAVITLCQLLGFRFLLGHYVMGRKLILRERGRKAISGAISERPVISASGLRILAVWWRFFWQVNVLSFVLAMGFGLKVYTKSLLSGSKPAASMIFLLLNLVASWVSFFLTTIRPFRRFTAVVEQANQSATSSKRRRVDDVDPAVIDHYKWIDSNGLEGKRITVDKADLNGYDLHDCQLNSSIITNTSFETADLSGATFDKAVLENSRFKSALLYGTQFHQADLRGADFGGSAALEASQLAGADLAGATLPDGLAFDTLATIEEAAKNARNLSITVLLACAYSWIAIAATKDTNLITNSSATSLPVISAAVPIVTFYVAGPLLVLVIYLYFQMSLQKIWSLIPSLPKVFQDGSTLSVKLYPWSVLEIVDSVGSSDIAKRSRRTLSYLASISYIYVVVPLTMVLYWSRYICNHDLLGSGLHIIAFGVALTISISYLSLAYMTLSGSLSGGSAEVQGVQGRRKRFRAAGLSAAVILCGLVWLFSHRAISEAQVAFDFAYASVAHQDVSSKPTTWNGKDVAVVSGARLSNHNLRYMEAAGAFLMKGDLRCTDLTGSDLTGADLRDADFYRARLSRAVLMSANLEHAIFFRANLTEADLRSANLRGVHLNSDQDKASIEDFANWLGFTLEGIDEKQQPRTEGATCVAPEDRAGQEEPKPTNQGATSAPQYILAGPGFDDPNAQILVTFRDRLDVMDIILSGIDGRVFHTALFNKAKLGGADLTDASLPGADFSNADFSSSVLVRAILRGAILTSAKLNSAVFTDADLEGVDLRSATGLSSDQLSVARTLYNAKLDPPLLQALKLRNPALFTKASADLALALEQVQLHPSSRATDIRLAEAYYGAGDKVKSEQIYRELLKQDPSDAEVLNNLGYHLADTQPQSAITLLQQALRFEPESGTVKDSLGWAYFRSGSLAEAEKLLVSAAKSLPQDSVVQEHLGDLYAAERKFPEAIQAWNRALTADQSHTNAERLQAKISQTKSATLGSSGQQSKK